MVKKAIDSRIPTLIRNGVESKRRSFFVVVGDRQKDVIVNLYHILLNIDIKRNKSVLWAYKKELLGFTSHRKKREKKIKKEIKRGIRDADVDDPFELFVSSQNIRYVYYKETEKILGNTFGICILQDFEAITPNILARTIETVEGGGLVILLLKGMNSLKQLYTLSMDIHSRYRTEAHNDVVSRFNERFILSLGNCETCLVVDDELNVLPVSGGKMVRPLPPVESDEKETPARKELREVQDRLADSVPVGPLVKLAKTLDQAKAVLTFVDAIAEKTLQSTVTLTAGRGRGKSAALGIAIAAAIAHGYSNIFITSPSPENLRTVFEFVFKAFDALEYMDHTDYTIIQSTNPDFHKAIVRVNVYRTHRQTIQYIQPQDAYALGQAELVVIDEAAAIPLPLVKKLMGPYLVFMASTINGYEGTGRSLSLKLIQQLRDQSRGLSKADSETKQVASIGNRTLREVSLDEPIRYAVGDPVERWLNKLLCLDATVPKKSAGSAIHHPSDCQLLWVNRDTLFSYHPVSEKFLHQMMGLYVSSHYKNTPNDLQLMSDAPAHQLFVLVPPVENESSRLPEPLCVVQVALEGMISRESVLNGLRRGQRAGGDLIPWLVSQQFQDEEFGSLSGARIVRIATNPDYAGMGYGSRAVELLVDFYSGKCLSLSESAIATPPELVRVTDHELEQATLLQDNIRVRDIDAMPPLFSRLTEIRPSQLDYVGVSYGMTASLHRFWKRSRFVPVYLRQTPNDLTGEHSCVMLRTLASDTTTGSSAGSGAWLADFSRDFHRRFLSLLSYQFRTFPSIVALAIEDSSSAGFRNTLSNEASSLSRTELEAALSPYDRNRLDSYANNMLDYHVILDLLPTIATLYFSGKLRSDVSLTGVQSSILAALGLQRKLIDDLETELGLGSSQLLAMFVKIIRKFATRFRAIEKDAIEATLEAEKAESGNNQDMDDMAGANDEDDGLPDSVARVRIDENAGAELQKDLDSGAKEIMRTMIDSLPLDRYAIADDDMDWSEAEARVKKAASKGKTVSSVSVRNVKKQLGTAATTVQEPVDATRSGTSNGGKPKTDPSTSERKSKNKRSRTDSDRTSKKQRK